MPGQLSLFKGKRQRGTKLPPAPEFALHCMVADILRRWATPEWRWTHFPAGELRDHRTDKRGNRYSLTGQRLKRMGVMPGWPDFILLAPSTDSRPLWPGRVHFLELKRQGGKLSDNQFEFMEFCTRNNYAFVCCDNLADAIHHLKSWGAVRASVSV